MTDTIWRPDLAQYDGPKYLALTRALRDSVRSGDLTEGSRLPPVRDLAWTLGITPGTVARAYAMATEEGLLTAAVGRGTFVAERNPRPGPRQALYVERRQGLVDLRSPQLPEIGQAAAISAAMRRVADKVGADYLEYPSLRRDIAAREALIGWIGARKIGPLDAEDIVLAHGGQSAINIVLQCCLRGERPLVMAEELAYPGLRHAARLNRADVLPLPLDAEGMIPEALDAACRRHGARMVFLTPEAQNPTTARMSLERRQAITRVARENDLQVIEDDCYSVAMSDLPALRALMPERCWYVSSLSKSFSAGLRFGFIVCPPGMGDAGRLTAQHGFFGLARPVTDICADLLISGEAAALRSQVQAVVDQRLSMLVAALGGHDLVWKPGLSFAWLHMPQGWRASTFAREAEAAGVLVRSADEYALPNGPAPNAVRIAIAAGIDEAAFAQALATLARLLRRPPGDLPV